MKAWLRSASVSFLALSGAGLAQAQQTASLDGPHRPFQDSLVEQLAGGWTMTGTIRGEPANLSLRAEWVLNHQFLRLEMRDVANPPEYQAHVYLGLDNTSERYVAHWIDVFGGRWSETLGYGLREGNAIRLVFEYPDGPFHTTFTFNPSTRTWTMHSRNRGPAGEWRDFAQLTLRRAPQ